MYFIINIMKKIARGLSAVIIMMFSLCILSACNGESGKIYTDVTHFGSALKTVLYCSDETYEKISVGTEKILDEISAVFDENDSESFISKFNAADKGEKVEINDIVIQAYKTAEKAYFLTGEYYDPTVANLVDLWGFSARFYNSLYDRTEQYDRMPDENGAFPLPDTEYINAFRSLCDFSAIKIVNEEGKTYLVKEKDGVIVNGKKYAVKLDFGGLAKGLAVERIIALCENEGVERGYVSYGSSSIYLLNNKNNSDWDLLLTDPRPDGSGKSDGKSAYFSAKLSNVSASTSGDYERYYILDGKRYSHIIDVESGMPAENGVYAVTVIGASPSLGDCLSTGLCAAGKEKIIEFAYSDFASENGIKIVAAFGGKNGEKEVFSTLESYEILSGNVYER